MSILSENDVTGRDDLIIMEALAYAIEIIERLPECCQEYSDKEDMKDLLAAIAPERTAKLCRESAKRHLDWAQVSVTNPLTLDKDVHEALLVQLRAIGAEDNAKALLNSLLGSRLRS